MKKILGITFIVLALLLIIFKVMVSVVIALGSFLLWFIPIALIVAALILFLPTKKKE